MSSEGSIAETAEEFGRKRELFLRRQMEDLFYFFINLVVIVFITSRTL